MSALKYPVPWRVLLGLGPHIARGTRTSVDAFSAELVARMHPAPEILGCEHLPDSPRFVLVANHFQREGLWILHPAAVLTQAIRKHYGPGDPPVRWIVTANWPRIRLGPIDIASPGDLLLPRVAEALACYPVSFAGTKPGYTAKTIRRLIRETPKSARPLGLFPEGVAGMAGRVGEPLPGVDRLLIHLAKCGMPVVPAGISDNRTLVIRFGRLVEVGDLLSAPDPAEFAMKRVAELI
jgi:1-acyl-sn-glycerol-3-phosphate acyltransferase